MYFVFTPSDVGECFGTDCFASNLGVGPGETSAFCAYHSFFDSNKIYAYQPFAGNGNCTIQSVFPNGQNLDITLSTVSHEMFEANTDPLINGWKGPGGNDDENGDKCSYTKNGGPGFTAPDGTNLVLNGNRYQIQWEWSNAVNGCTKRLDPPAANLSTPSLMDFGTHQAGSASVPLPLNIANTAGSGDANILYIRLGSGSNTRFSIPTIPPTWATLHGGQALPETVAFNPLAPPGIAAGTVIIDTDYTTSTAGVVANEIPVNLAGVVVFAPTISKSFAAPKKVIPGGIIALSFTVGNPNSFAALPGVGFADTLPVGLVVNTPNGLSGSCGGGTITAVAGSNSISLANATLAASASCTFSVNVTAATDGIYINTTGAVFSLYGSGLTATDTLFVAKPPTLSKGFGSVTLLPGGSTNLSFSLTNPNSFVTLNGLAFSDALPAGLLVSTPNGLAGSCDGGTITATAGSNIVTLTNATLSPGASCTFSVSVTAAAFEVGLLTNTTSTVTSNEALPGAAASASIFVGNPFQVRSASNLGIGDSVINITNTGTSSTNAFPAQNGNICVNVYTFSPDEQLISCCSCPVTPDGLDSLSARNDLISNTLTPGVPTSIVTKILASSSATCNASTVSGASVLATGLAAWGTTIHALPVTPGSPSTTYGVTETPFTPATLSVAELTRITTLCGFIQSNGSGFGICRSCRLGGLGATQ